VTVGLRGFSLGIHVRHCGLDPQSLHPGSEIAGQARNDGQDVSHKNECPMRSLAVPPSAMKVDLRRRSIKKRKKTKKSGDNLKVG